MPWILPSRMGRRPTGWRPRSMVPGWPRSVWQAPTAIPFGTRAGWSTPKGTVPLKWPRPGSKYSAMNITSPMTMKIQSILKSSLALLVLSLALLACNDKKDSKGEDPGEGDPGTTVPPPYEGDLPLDRLNLPEGFSIDVYAENLDGARSMALGDDGTLFVGTRNQEKVYALRDTDGDHRADEVYEVAS